MLSHVLELSRGIGREVLGPDRAAVGRLTDLSVRLDGHPDADGAPHRVHRLLIHPRRGPDVLVPWEAVAALHAGQVVLDTADLDAFPIGGPVALQPDEILLARDVLDTQVVDVVGHRLARVAEVLLARTRDSGLEVAGVEVGFRGVLRRLGLRRAAVGEDVVAWPDLHLTSERGHRVQLSTPRAAVHRLDPRALAALVSRLDTDAATEILASREPAVAADAVAVAPPEVSERVLRAMPSALAARIVAAMPLEHARHWRARLARTPGRRFLRSRAWPHRRHLIRGHR